jgi:hypothetical protein
MDDLSRRSMLTGVPAVAGAALLGAHTASAAPLSRPNLADPAVRARLRARIIGSCARETVFLFYRLHIYGYAGDGNLIPFFTMNHLNVSEWTPLPGNLYQSKTFESGVYCKFNTDEPLDTWVNPITGEARKVWQFYGGPFTVTIGADGIVTKGADLRPELLRMEEMGDMLFVPTSSSAAFPNAAAPEAYPHLSSGKTIFWESHATYAAKLEDAYNEKLTSAPAFCQFQNMASWHPWLGMGGRPETKPGRTWGRAYGTKLASLDQIPAGARRSLESHTPDIFNWQSWTGMRNDMGDYLKTVPKG